MSDTDSIKTDRSQSELQQKYDKLAMEFAKARMQLNVLKKAYTAKTSKFGQRSVESLDQFENCKYDTMSTNSLDFQEDFHKSNQLNSKVKVIEEMKSKEIQLLKQDMNSMNHYIRRILDSTKLNQLDYNLIISEIDNCKGIQNNSPNIFCEVFNNEFTALKCSVTACLYNILCNKLDSRTKINTEDSRLIYPNYYCLDDDCNTDEDKLQKLFINLVLNLFLSFIETLHCLLEFLLKEINPENSLILQKCFKALTNKLQNNDSLLGNILSYSNELKELKFNRQYILMENIVLFISNKYIAFVECIKKFMKPDNTTQMDCSPLRRNIISLMALKFPVQELVSIGEYWDLNEVNNKLNGVYDTVHTLLRAINILEFEYFYKSSQVDMHWHMKNPLTFKENSRQINDELNLSISPVSLEKVYIDKLQAELNKSLSLEQEKNHWENEYKLLCKKNEYNMSKNDKSKSNEIFIIENQLGKCELSSQYDDNFMARENELKSYYEEKINSIMYKNKYLSSQNNAYALELTSLKTRLDHSILVRNELELKIRDALEHIEDLKEEFHLTSTNYEAQLKAMTEHLASLNETVVLERKHIDNLNNQLKTKENKKKTSK